MQQISGTATRAEMEHIIGSTGFPPAFSSGQEISVPEGNFLSPDRLSQTHTYRELHLSRAHANLKAPSQKRPFPESRQWISPFKAEANRCYITDLFTSGPPKGKEGAAVCIDLPCETTRRSSERRSSASWPPILTGKSLPPSRFPVARPCWTGCGTGKLFFCQSWPFCWTIRSS